MNIDLDKDKRLGIIGTVLFHIAALLILFFISMSPPDPPRPPIGMEINLGYSDKGMGDDQPDKPVESSIPQPQAQPPASEEKVATQDVEQTISLDNTKKTKKAKKTQKTPVDKKVEETKKEPEINQAYTFKKSNKSSNNKSDGDDNTPGNKGKVDGDINSDNYAGVGGKGNSPSYSLGGRKAKSIKKPVNNSSEQGTVVVKIWVDRDGKVTNAKINKGTNTSNAKLQKLALESAMKAHFDSNPNAPENQIGTITYVFVL